MSNILNKWILFLMSFWRIETTQTKSNETVVVGTAIDQTLVNSSRGMLNYEIGGLECRVVVTEYRTRVHGYTCNTSFVPAYIVYIHMGLWPSGMLLK